MQRLRGHAREYLRSTLWFRVGKSRSTGKMFWDVSMIPGLKPYTLKVKKPLFTIDTGFVETLISKGSIDLENLFGPGTHGALV